MSTPRPPYTVEELENTPYIGTILERAARAEQPRFVFIVWNNECIDYSEIRGVYATKEAADAAKTGLFFDVIRVPFYEH